MSNDADASVAANPDAGATPGEELKSTGTSVLFAAGARGVRLFIPPTVTLAPVAAPIVEKPATLEDPQRAIVAAALNASALKDLARCKRRAVVLVGDLSRPARYDIALPAVMAALAEADIRPSRTAFIACPGGNAALLGRSAIHRYGEEICGDHEVIAWPAEGTPGAIFDSADLRIAVAPRRDDTDFDAFLPASLSVDLSLELVLGRNTQIEIEAAHVISDHKNSPPASVEKSADADVLIVSGGGAPWENTLEEALLSLHAPRATARTAVLLFAGEEGLGASRFSRDVWSLLEQAEEVLAAGKSLGKPSASNAFDAVTVLAECLKRFSHTILFSPGFAEHSEGDDLIDRLNAAPHVGARLGVCASHAALWQTLEIAHGPAYTLHAEPLGWRA